MVAGASRRRSCRIVSARRAVGLGTCQPPSSARSVMAPGRSISGGNAAVMSSNSSSVRPTRGPRINAPKARVSPASASERASATKS